MSRHWISDFIPVAIVVILAGCGGAEPEKAASLASTVAVKGKVTLKGKPLTQGSISFEPADGGREAFGNINSDGTFTLTTFRKEDGAVRGKHRVAVKAAGGGKKDPVPLKYQSYSSSGVEVDVIEDKPDITIELK